MATNYSFTENQVGEFHTELQAEKWLNGGVGQEYSQEHLLWVELIVRSVLEYLIQ